MKPRASSPRESWQVIVAVFVFDALLYLGIAWTLFGHAY